MGSSSTTVRLSSVSSVSPVCFVTSPWRGASPGLDLGTGYMTNAKRTYCPVDRSAPTLSVARATRARQGRCTSLPGATRTAERHAVAGLPRDSRYLLHDGRTRIVCNRRFQVFLAVKPNRLGKTRRTSDFTEPIIVSLRKLLRVYYLLWLCTSPICLSESYC